MTSSPHPPPDRCVEGKPRLLTLDRALDRIRAALRALDRTERVPLGQALGRILAEDIRAPLDLPPFSNSAMDGYAIRAKDFRQDAVFRVVGTIWAGRPLRESLDAGQAMRIFTGAALPENADCVIPQEDAIREGDEVRFGAGAEPGRNVRPRGGEIRAGDILLKTGRRLAPVDVGLLAATGVAEVNTRCRLRVALFSTGDELKPVTATLGHGEIHECNRYLLGALLTELGAEVLDLGTVPDEPGTIAQSLRDAANSADVVITSGGASVGDADFVVDTVRTIGELEFWKVAFKPGKPFAFGRIGASYFFGLPGNPVSVLLTFRQLVRPALRQLMGMPPASPLRFGAICENRLIKSPGRLEFQRGFYQRGRDGVFTVAGVSGQGADRLTSVSRANCYIVLPIENAGVEPGDMVEIEPFDGPP